MTRFSWSVWFSRLIITAATFVMSMIALRSLRDPIAATLPMGIVLTSPAAITVVRVGFGGFPLGFAIALFGCLISTRRLLTWRVPGGRGHRGSDAGPDPGASG